MCCGERDRTTEFYQERYKEWEHFSNCVNLRVIENAGHFFQKHQADILAQIIVDQVEKWKNIRSSEFVEEALEETVDKKKVKTSIFDKANVKPSMKLFLFIALGQIVSMFGTSLTGFALGYWIYKETGSVSYYTLISVCTLLPNILISPIAGAVADRWDRRKIMIISDTFAAMGTLAIALLLWSGRLEIWHIYRNNKKIINSKRYILTPYHVKVVGCFFKYIFFMNIKSLRSVSVAGKSNNKNIKKYLTQSQAFFTFFCLTGKNFYAFAGTVFLPCQSIYKIN